MVFRLTIFLVAVMLVSGCSIYKMSIRQGNIIEQEDIDLITKGMSKSQIEYILGRPLIDDPFAANTWYYVNTYKDGRSDKETSSKLIVEFADGRVIRMSGDFDIPEGLAASSQPSQ